MRKSIIVCLIAGSVLLGGAVAYGHGNPGVLSFATMEKTDSNKFTYGGTRSGSVQHASVHLNACLWHKNANGWHVHGNSCVHGHVNTAKGISIRVSGTVSCPESDGPWRSRIKSWDEGSGGTPHNTLYDNSDTPYPNVNC